MVVKNIRAVSNPEEVFKKAEKYGIPKGNIRISHSKNKKYDVLNPDTKKWISFGDIAYEDYTKHQDPERRARYLARATKILGDWKDDKYSANSLSINLLW